MWEENKLGEYSNIESGVGQGCIILMDLFVQLNDSKRIREPVWI